MIMPLICASVCDHIIDDDDDGDNNGDDDGKPVVRIPIVFSLLFHF